MIGLGCSPSCRRREMVVLGGLRARAECSKVIETDTFLCCTGSPDDTSDTVIDNIAEFIVLEVLLEKKTRK